MTEPQPGFFDKERILASPGFNRWMVPPAALAIHLCIGMAYGFSVFWLPLSKALGIHQAIACPAEVGFFPQLFTTTCDWPLSTLGWMYTFFFVCLGTSASLFGGWVERVGPRTAALVSAACWCGGLLVSAAGVHWHQFWLMVLGSGVIGGIGLGLGYTSPVSTLIQWFPDHRGMASGMAIMGFGGGAMVGSPLSVALMRHFAGPTDVGVAATFVILALVYGVFMVAGALTYRLPAIGWKPAGWTPPATHHPDAMVTPRHVHVKHVWSIPQFWLLWMALCMNVSAGIGVIGMASPMLQEVFGGALIGTPHSYDQLDTEQLAAVASVAAGFIALLSLFNIGGRFFWASLSDALGRKATFAVFFIAGALLFCSVPGSATHGKLLLFVGAVCLIVSMYGGGFATMPAYLADLFGTHMVGPILGRLLTAWATAGVLGPVIVNYMREYQRGLGLPPEQVYNQTMYILAGLLVVGLVCNLLVRPLADKWFMGDAELAASRPPASGAAAGAHTATAAATTHPAHIAMAWLAVGLPMAWGVYRTLQSVAPFFTTP